jgi:hypothetical protein
MFLRFRVFGFGGAFNQKCSTIYAIASLNKICNSLDSGHHKDDSKSTAEGNPMQTTTKKRCKSTY